MNYLHISIYVFLIIVLILSLFLFFKIYSKIKSSDKTNINLIEFPKETSLKIENFIKENKKNNEELVKYLDSQYNDAKSIIKEVDDKIKPFEKVAILFPPTVPADSSRFHSVSFDFPVI